MNAYFKFKLTAEYIIPFCIITFIIMVVLIRSIKETRIKKFFVSHGYERILLDVASFGGDTVAHFAHLGGMLFGYFLIRYWKKKDADNGRYFY